MSIFAVSIVFVWYYFGIVACLAASIAFLSGIVEDLLGNVSQKTRLIIQTLAAFIFVFFGNLYLKTIGLGIEFPYLLALLFTMFAIVGVINAVNIIDGLNGLASGIAITSFAVFATFAVFVSDDQLLLLCLVLIASILGFFVFNFPFGKIFLGDGGAYYLGFMLASVAILIVVRHPSVSAWFCLSVVIYPIWEVIFSILRRRMVVGRRATEPDKMHLHQVLMRSQKISNHHASLKIIAVFFPFQLCALFIYDKGYLLFALIILFILFYQFSYHYLLNNATISGKNR